MRTVTEFEAFGPWIYPVRTAADLPRLFRDSGIDPETQRLVLKVPRNIERRDASPGMDLYDWLIAVDDEVVTLLRRVDDGYATLRVPMDRITAIEDSVSMLDGLLTLHTTDGVNPTITYNGADLPPVQGLIQLLRQKYLPAAAIAPYALPGVVLNLGEDDTGLVTAYRQLLDAEPHLRVVSAFPSLTVGAGSIALRVLQPATLHGAIAVTDEREIQLIHRRTGITRGRDKALSTARTIIPRSRITDVDVRAHKTYRGVTVITVNGTVRIPVPTGPSADALTELLAAAPARS